MKGLLIRVGIASALVFFGFGAPLEFLSFCMIGGITFGLMFVNAY